MIAAWFTRQLVFDGAINGLLVGLLAMGIVLVNRSTRVINFAVGNMGLVGTGLLALLVVKYDVPFWIAAPLCVLAGVVFAAAAEMAVVRRLFHAPRVIVVVGTIGIAQVALAVVTALPKLERTRERFPTPLHGSWKVAGVTMTGPHVSIIIGVPLLAVALGWMVHRTRLGKAIRASANNVDLARLSGVSPKIVSTIVWAIAGGVATVTLMLVAGRAGAVSDLASLGPATLARALVAALIGGMVSFPRALAAGVMIGVVEALVGFNFLDQTGLIDAIILIAVLLALVVQSRRGSTESQPFSFAPRVRALPDNLRGVWWLRALDRIGLGALGVFALVLPLIVTQPSRVLLYTTVLAYAICALSLTVLTGWAGQLSLGQMAFAGIGALSAAALTHGVKITFGIGDHHWFSAESYPLPFWLSIMIAGAIAAVIAVIIGTGALRVRGLLLAVATFVFALAAQQYLYRRPILSGGSSLTVPFPRGRLFGIDMRSQRAYYYAVLAVLVIVVVTLNRMRRSGVGRRIISVRDNPATAAAYTVNATGTKLTAFALAGMLAGVGGALLAGAVQNVPFTERFFLVNDSLVIVALVVIGGLGSTTGAVLGAVWVVGLPALAPDNALVPLLTSSLGLLVLLLYFPGGLAQIGSSFRDHVVAWAARRAGTDTAKRVHSPPAAITAHARQRPSTPTPIALEASGIAVRFGGIRAVDNASIAVPNGSIVGLIGANGAGKSTLMNAIGGYVPAHGRVTLNGVDVTGRAPHRRAALGLGRTFQAATLFPELTVHETVLVAMEGRRRSSLLGTVTYWPPTSRTERTKRAEASDIVDFLGLGRYSDHYIADLSTGTRRIVEIACLLAIGADVLCLDEPTAGVAQREAEAFGPLIIGIRAQMNASVLIIEHDMPLIMAISDEIYCLDSGRVIAHGDPSSVRNDPRVIASYLGTDERAIARSGTAVESITPDLLALTHLQET